MSKGMKHMAGALAMMAMLGEFGTRRNSMSKFEDEDFEPKEVKKPIPNGCKEFTFKGITVVALSEKRARIKIDKMLKKASG